MEGNIIFLVPYEIYGINICIVEYCRYSQPRLFDISEAHIYFVYFPPPLSLNNNKLFFRCEVFILCVGKHAHPHMKIFLFQTYDYFFIIRYGVHSETLQTDLAKNMTALRRKKPHQINQCHEIWPSAHPTAKAAGRAGLLIECGHFSLVYFDIFAEFMAI